MNRKKSVFNKNTFFYLLWLVCGTLSIFANPITVYSEQTSDNGYIFYADNPFFIPQFLVLNFPVLSNLEASVSLPLRIVLEPHAQRVPLLSLRAIRSASYSYRSSFVSSKGKLDAVHDPDVLYLLPWAHGQKYRLTQANNGVYTHFGENQYAWDFDLNIGDTVHAARDGLVVEVKQDSNRGGPGNEFVSHANYILIYHNDGSFGNYVHLKQNGSLVKPGDYVLAGQAIAYSGNTGRSSGPHLHFDVRIPRADGKMMSVPIRFQNPDGQAWIPEEGEFLYAWHPNSPPFSTLFGLDLADDDYKDTLNRIPLNKKTTVRTEVLDASYIVFFQNGTDKKLEVEYTLKLQNYRSSQANPRTIIVPAESEVFMTILHPILLKERGSFQINYRMMEIR
jgi:murein DD-endopeptidase MepM/ murein hydrolase activator NlpD